MDHDVYICYDEKDEKLSDAVYHMFQQNNIKPWVKSKEMSEGDPVNKITDAIAASKCFILILSKNSIGTNPIITETDIAFSKNIPIIALNVDDVKLEGKFEFILESQTLINSFPDAKKQLEILVKETSKIIGRKANNVSINSQSVKAFELVNPVRKEKIIKKVLAVAIPIAIMLILVYLFVIVPTGQHTTDDGVFSMNITDVDVTGSAGSYKYTVYGESYNLPSNSASYLMNIKFLDENDNLVYEINSTADEFKSGVICECDLPNDNVTHIDFKLFDINHNVLSNETYVID